MNLKIINYENIKIEEHELVRLAQIGNQAAIDVLIKSYTNYIKTICNAFYLLGAEKEDIHQEAMIGFYKAICKYDLESNATFKTFAVLCIKQQIYKAIQESAKPKHKLHLNSISLDQSINKDSKKGTILDVFIDDYANNPEQKLLKKEEWFEFTSIAKEILSYREYRCLELFLKGETFKNIAVEIGTSRDYCYQILRKAKRKLINYYSSNVNKA